MTTSEFSTALLDRALVDQASSRGDGEYFRKGDNGAIVGASPARFWVLFAFSALAIMQSAAWNIYAPIQKEVKLAFQWHDDFIKWAVNVANIAFVVVLLPTSMAISRFGFRAVVIGSGFILLASCCMRLCSFIPGIHDGNSYKYISIAGMVLNGASGGVSNFGGAILSQRWFPPRERTTATAVGTVSCYLGSAMGFLLGPLIVGEPSAKEAAAARIGTLFVWEAVLVSVFLFACCLYFP